MSSKRKQLLLALLLTAAILVPCVLIVVFVARVATSWKVPEPPQIVVDGSVPEEVRAERRVIFCLPVLEPRTGTQFIGVAVVDLSKPYEQNVVRSGGKGTWKFSPECQLAERSWRSWASVQNVIARTRSDGPQRLLFSSPTMVDRLVLPQEPCETSSGLAPCDHLYWEVRQEDTNGDGVINDRDVVAAYLSNLDASEFWRVTPEAWTLVAIERDTARDTYVLQVHTDEDGDGVFGPRDPVRLLEYSIPGKEILGPVVADDVAERSRRMLE